MKEKRKEKKIHFSKDAIQLSWVSGTFSSASPHVSQGAIANTSHPASAAKQTKNIGSMFVYEPGHLKQILSLTVLDARNLTPVSLAPGKVLAGLIPSRGPKGESISWPFLASGGHLDSLAPDPFLNHSSFHHSSFLFWNQISFCSVSEDVK